MSTDYLYIVEVQQKKDYTKAVIEQHVEFLRKLDESGKLVLGGPLPDERKGMLILRVESKVEAEEIAKSDPFFTEGFSEFRVMTLHWAKRENDYLM